ncbi:MAG: DUF3021 domain-containing protein [Clostridia bacterium]|nr:DUF3021 domain-containing protein [Clostridia bacterium]
MKKHVLDFLHRGAIACGLGPIVLAVLYLILQKQAGVQTLTVNQICTGIFSLTALAFIAGGMNAVYQIERLPLMAAIFIHGGVLYVSYLGTYLLNGWLEGGTAPILVFSAVFVIGYLIIWAIIYSITRQRTGRINEILKQKQQNTEAEENG